MRRISGLFCLLAFVLALIPSARAAEPYLVFQPHGKTLGISFQCHFWHGSRARRLWIYGGRKPICCCRGRAEYPLLWALAYEDLLYTAGAQEYSNVNLANYGG